jgi:hypothetical protein
MTSKEFSPWIPFDLYDFFGYLFPGIYFAISIVFIFLISNPSFSMDEYWKVFAHGEFMMGFVSLLTLIVIVYLLGHFIATISHVVIDRAIVGGIIGYPILHLLRLKRPEREYSESTIKYLFILFNTSLLLPAFIYSHVCFIGTTTIFFCIICFLFCFRIFMTFLRMRPNGGEIAKKYGDKKIFRIYLFPAQKLIDPLFLFVRRVLAIDKQFSQEFIEKYMAVFKSRFGLESENQESENYWLPFFYVSDKSPYHASIIRTWLHLYGYARNISSAAYIICIISIILMFKYPYLYENQLFLYHYYFSLSVAFVLSSRYWILYSTYYTKSIIRAFISI